MSVPNNRPPIMEAANEPNMESVNRGIIPRIVVSEAIMTGRNRLCALSMSAVVGSVPPVELQCDFVHQYNSVFNKHTDKSQGTYDGNKVEGLSGYEHDRYDTD